MQEGLSGLLTAMFPFGIIVLGTGIAAAAFYWSRQRKSATEMSRADRASEELYEEEQPKHELQQQRR